MNPLLRSYTEDSRGSYGVVSCHLREDRRSLVRLLMSTERIREEYLGIRPIYPLTDRT